MLIGSIQVFTFIVTSVDICNNTFCHLYRPNMCPHVPHSLFTKDINLMGDSFAFVNLVWYVLIDSSYLCILIIPSYSWPQFVYQM